MRLSIYSSILLLRAMCLVRPTFGFPATTCRCMPGDSCWPSSTDWAHFNASIGGRLIATQPLAQACHDPYYNETECQYLQKHWTLPALHDISPSSIMAAAVAKDTCDAFTPRSKPCAPGDMVVYSVNASSPDDFSRTIRFSQQRNIRLVIRNTGHDYLGKSTGAGALSIWTHYLKDIEFVNYTSSSYTGPAFTMAAGVQGSDIYNVANGRGLVVVGGECASVGPVGGYTQGGGHSALSSRFGLAADQVLEWQVVDGTGRLLTASPTQNPDLYWALSGGGGGTYGVVYSMTVKAFPDFPVTGVVLQFDTKNTSSKDFFQAVSYYHRDLPTYTAAGGMAIAQITRSSFLLTPLTLPNKTTEEARSLIAPFIHELETLHIPYQLNITQSATYLEHYKKLIEPNPTQLVQNGQYGGRLLPLNVIESNNTQLTEAVKTITQDGVVFVGIGLNVSSSVVGDVWNSVLPAWRTAALSVLLSTDWPAGANRSTMKTLADRMTSKWVPILTALSPDSGCYMNEADPQQPDWPQTFYGRNYETLYAIKKRYDPFDTFYASTAVGSGDWQVKTDGRLCRVKGNT
ncbi:FAD-dependent oxidoreductase [Aspergillus clavatus NRRL 1]|uniref:FAD-linked oxidoreductase patO n=1 Tax=Aspergillus clavatus (strain ATCC 1007 / CBS 513.65 / DSM 816 / NCTC 3887 / NRRL 1 / QM 1276 / 107) TaxID=344612 RepID=PATO_ASPCL|nr:FAD binding domain protein [Aspergillus clavatus NRRL 1]A1CFM2.1 RecName: Full=FAD-linked oxidoreductase patO; AltName: Full=Patulin synthesis protein O; Flags: Precursor [Aspergillus clavatus NRRL 1]EAW11671.1 FAD binding domain protein [Aspergillus clavatus NRRL 1]